MANTSLLQAASKQGRGIAPILLCLLTGCASPVVTSVNLGILGTTGKSVEDHALSYTQDRDCKTFRIVKGEQVCQMTTVQAMEDTFNKRRQ